MRWTRWAPMSRASLTASDGSEGIAPGSTAYRRLSWALWLAGLSTFSLLYAVQPLLPGLADHYRLSAEGASLAVSLATGPLALGLLVAGPLSDRLGRRPLMVFAMFAGSVATLAAALAPGWGWLLAARVLAGVALAGVPSVAMAYVADEVDARAVGRTTGLYVAGSAMGGMSGRVIASLVADMAGPDGGWRWALAAVGLAGLAAAEAFRRLAPHPRAYEPRRARVAELARGYAVRLADGGSLALYALSFLSMGAFVSVYNYAGFRLAGPPYSLGQAAAGSVFLLYLTGSASASAFGRMADARGWARVLPWPAALMTAGVALTAAGGLAMLVLGIATVTIGFFGAHAIASAAASARGGAAGRGQASALYLFAYYLGSSVLGSLGGVAWSRAGWTGVTWFCVGLGALAIGAAITAGRAAPPRRPAAGPPAPEPPLPPAP